MGRVARLALTGSALLAMGAAPRRVRPPTPAAAPAPTTGPVTGPTAEYWVSAATASGFGAGLAGGGRPSMGAVLRMAAGRGPSVSRSLTLQLGSTQPAQGTPQADHFVPPGLGMGASLPLVTPPPPQPGRAVGPAEPGSPESYQRPRGRLLIYWGCGEHVGPGQPEVIDFAGLGAGAPLPDLGGAVRVAVERPPGAEGAVTYGRWPNEKRRVEVPQTGSLVGAHDVRSDYAPEIRFDVGPELDFMPPLELADAGPSAEGGKRLTWRPAAAATGYHLMLIGAQGGRGDPAGGGGGDMVFWSSSAVKPGVFGAGLGDYLAPAEVARLVRERAVLPPAASECIVPTEVARAAPAGLVSAIGYGPEQVWTDPPRPRSGPWAISWRARLRLKTTATLLLGLPTAGRDPGRPRPPNAGDLLRGLRPF